MHQIYRPIKINNISGQTVDALIDFWLFSEPLSKIKEIPSTVDFEKKSIKKRIYILFGTANTPNSLTYIHRLQMIY